ncbi:MAG: hypothetical protein FWE67_04090 [Planctomycetaceae bacterium]|nr:hypothetical protein [Planctomycetaceae bacterium]
MSPLPSEKTAQELFYEQFNLPTEAVQHNCDGYYNGCLLEFKKSNRTTLNSALFQSIKYLSSFRVRGIPVPANILLIFPSDKRVYVFKSENYRQYIHKLYNDSASRNTRNFTKLNTDYETIDYASDKGIHRLIQLFHKNKPQWVKIQIDEHCVVGWAQTFYRLRPDAKKEDFLHESDDLFTTYGELREPIVLADYILPYLEVGNQKFKYILDKLNDKLTQKELGAFYTPPLYAQKALELVRKAIKEIPEGNDYVIIDRCAGSGNLEEAMTDEELSHCILNTYEYFEYLVLRENFGDKVREIIPPTTDDDYEAVGKVKGSNALNWQDGVHPVMKQYLDNPKCSVILFENPPYSDASGDTIQTGEARNVDKDSIVAMQFKKNFKSGMKGNVPSKDIANLFIWSAFKYYLRQPKDSYILFSPVKYFKNLALVNKTFRGGYAFNRKHFHASPATISCIWWQNKEKEQETFVLKAFDIAKVKWSIDVTSVVCPVKKSPLLSEPDTSAASGECIFTPNNAVKGASSGKGTVSDILVPLSDVVIKKCYTSPQDLFDKRTFPDDTFDGVYCRADGTEAPRQKSTATENVYNKNILGYLHLVGLMFNGQAKNFTRTTINLRKNGFYLRTDNYIVKLPLFCAKCYPQENWFERDVFFTTADKGDAYTKDKDFLFRCFFWSCLSQKNHCLSFDGSDGRFYRNELCFDKDTIASKEISTHTLNPDEKQMLDLWNALLKKVKRTPEYNPHFTYGLYQIEKEINVQNDVKEYIHPDIHNDIQALKVLLKAYYAKYIVKKLFEYELLK